MSTQGDGGAPLSDDQLYALNSRQKEIYSAKLSRFAKYLDEKGKNPKKGEGYANVEVRISRFHRPFRWIWENEEVTTEFTTEHADILVNALNEDKLRQLDGDVYAEASKRKIVDVLKNWFEYKGIEWEPEIKFTDNRAKDNADPYSQSELRDLWQASLKYKSIPNYNNLSPEERDRWKGHIAQDIGKPKEDVRPADWDQINNDWKVPSLIRTAREAGWRPDLIGRMEVGWYDPETQTIYIPEGEAPKNDSAWDQELSVEGALALENWLEQRSNQEIYDGREEIWLNRKGNPYNSGSLNDLLDNLMEEAEINQRGRKLVWYSFRHSIGTYVYHEYNDLRIVAETLRQNSIGAADRYVHPLPELKQEVAELM